MVRVKGIIIRGIGDATENLKKQRPFFISIGIKKSFLQNGTINIDIAPYKWEILKPDYEVKDVEWKPGFKEDFRFVRLTIRYKGKGYDGYMYNPAKAPHSENIIEVLTEPIKGIVYGQSAELIIPDNKLRLTR